MKKIESATSVKQAFRGEEPTSDEDRLCQRVLNLVNETENEGIFIAAITVKRKVFKEPNARISQETKVHLFLDEKVSETIRLLEEDAGTKN